MILVIIIYIISLVRFVQAGCCLQDRGEYTKFNSYDNPNFQCFNGLKYTDSIKFYCTFAKVPQIMIATLSYEYDRDVQFQFKILTTTTQEWSFSIQCFSPTAKLTKYIFTWIAIDDNKIFVVNDYLDSTQLVDGYISPYHKHPNSNGNLTARTTIVSYFGGNADTFVDYLTSDSAAFKVWRGTSGLGVQLILGWSECFQPTNQMSLSPFLPNLQVAVIQDINYTPMILHHARYVINYLTEQESLQKSMLITQTPQTDGTLTINVQWVGNGFTYFFYWTYFGQIGQFYEPLYYKKMRVSKKVNLDSQEYDLIWKLHIDEVNKNYTDSGSFNLEGQYSTLSLIYMHQCFPGLKIIGSILRCKDCDQKYYNFTQYCNKNVNQIKFFVFLIQQIQSDLKINLQLNNNGLIIQQTINISSICLETDTYQLMNLQILN